ncbi:hypothetical protein HBI98_01130 [Aeromonas veronii]|nr:hypothetical protein [Aeromonas veronii]
MATPQSPEEQQAALDAMASMARGEPQQKPQASQEPTKQEKAMEQLAPKTEGEQQQQSAAVFELNVGNGQKRQLTESQILGMMDRYKNLNYQQMQSKPLLDAATQAMQDLGMNQDQFLGHMQELMAKAKEKNTQFGGKDEHPNKVGAPPNQGADPDFDSQLKAWEDQNAASLPPMYKDMLAQQRQMASGLTQMQQMMQQLIASQNGQLRAAAEVNSQAQQQGGVNLREAIANNLNRVQQQLSLPDETANDFMTFSAERGYSLEDFIDPNLAIKVATDFKNSMESGEMARLKEISQRRQAYTGATDQAALGGGASPANNPDLEALTGFIKSRRG